MQIDKGEWRLAAILHADVQGYSRLISEDEPTTLRLLSAHLQRQRLPYKNPADLERFLATQRKAGLK
jgi:hypothetical protein